MRAALLEDFEVKKLASHYYTPFGISWNKCWSVASPITESMSVNEGET